MERFNRFFYGFPVGLLLPVLFLWLYLSLLYPGYEGLFATVAKLFSSSLFAKLLILSIFPDLILTFVFYKSDSFKLSMGILSGGMPYLILSIFTM